MALPGSAERASARGPCTSGLASQSYFCMPLSMTAIKSLCPRSPRASAASGRSVSTLASRRRASACSFFALSIHVASRLLLHSTLLASPYLLSPLDLLLCFVCLPAHVITEDTCLGPGLFAQGVYVPMWHWSLNICIQSLNSVLPSYLFPICVRLHLAFSPHASHPPALSDSID